VSPPEESEAEAGGDITRAAEAGGDITRAAEAGGDLRRAAEAAGELGRAADALETSRGGSPHPPRGCPSPGLDAGSLPGGYETSRGGSPHPPRAHARRDRAAGRPTRRADRSEYPLGLAWYAACRHLARVLFVTLCGIRVYHRERMPRRGGVLVISNHQSYLDPILAGVGMTRPLHPMARETLFRFAPLRWIIRSLYAFPVRPASADLGAVREALRRLEAGAVVLMFPEGTRTRDGSIGPLQAGPVTIAARAGVPIVPMVIDGAFEAWPRTSLLPWPHRIRVAFGEAVALPVRQGGPGRPDDQEIDADSVMAEVRRRMLELQAELRRIP